MKLKMKIGLLTLATVIATTFNSCSKSESKAAPETTAVTFTVNLDANYTESGLAIGVRASVSDIASGGTAAKPTLYSSYDRTNYTLISWNTKADGTGTEFKFGETKVTADITIYAQWKIIRSVLATGEGEYNGVVAIGDNVYYTSKKNNRIYKFSITDNARTVFVGTDASVTQVDGAAGTSTAVSQPTWLAANKDKTYLYVYCSGSSKIVRVKVADGTTNIIRTDVGSGGTFSFNESTVSSALALAIGSPENGRDVIYYTSGKIVKKLSSTANTQDATVLASSLAGDYKYNYTESNLVSITTNATTLNGLTVDRSGSTDVIFVSSGLSNIGFWKVTTAGSPTSLAFSPTISRGVYPLVADGKGNLFVGVPERLSDGTIYKIVIATNVSSKQYVRPAFSGITDFNVHGMDVDNKGIFYVANQLDYLDTDDTIEKIEQ